MTFAPPARWPRRAVSWRGPLLALLALVGLPHCERKADPYDAPAQPTEAEAPSGERLPPLELRDDTPGTLLTWVDDEGEFRVAQRPADVPEAARATVRVVVQGKPAGTPETVYVADLTQKQADGRYPVRTMPRAAWDELGAERRQARIKELTPPVEEVPPGSGGPVVIYGADWCKPCHQAEDYLRQRKVAVVLKDIEQDPAAQAEMQRKLAAANLRNASIPVIDVGGTLLVGFSPRALDAALAKLPKDSAEPASP